MSWQREDDRNQRRFRPELTVCPGTDPLLTFTPRCTLRSVVGKHSSVRITYHERSPPIESTSIQVVLNRVLSCAFTMDQQKRRDEILAKKAKLAELRQTRELRAREIAQRELGGPGIPDVGNASTW